MLADVCQPKRQEWNYFLWAIPLDVGSQVRCLATEMACLLATFTTKTATAILLVITPIMMSYGTSELVAGTTDTTSKSAEVINMKFVEDLSRWTSTRRLGRTG
jgi:hypothetical protein